jgi:hypothetical protein
VMRLPAKAWYVVDKPGGYLVAGPYKSATQAALSRVFQESIDGRAYALEEREVQ